VVTNTTSPPGGSQTVTPTGTGSFTAILTGSAKFTTGQSYSLTAAQNLGGTAKATCTT
jgi:hypothetical protein